jgi:DNA-binding transcriptional LysR family regulator
MGVKSAMSLKQYAAADHSVVSLFLAAVEAVASSGLVATVPRRLAEKYSRQFDVRVVSVPPELQRYEYWMVWHPLLNTDAAH